jgi:phage head maturation protease
LVDGTFAGKRYGKGWDLANFKRNPVVVLAHQYQTLPVGQVTRIWTDAVGARKRLRATLTFSASNPVGQAVLDLFREGVLRAVSVGFYSRGKPYSPETASDRADLGLGAYGVLHADPELLEISPCPVPANPNAVQEAFDVRGGSRGPAEAALVLRSLAGSRHTDVGQAVRDYDAAWRRTLRALETVASEAQYERNRRRAINDFERGMRRRLT